MSVWNPDNIKDVAESLGINSLSEDVIQGLCSDIEYRLSQVLEEALKFMRHSKRSNLSTQDIAQALRVLDVEPLYGYESTRPLRFGEASIGPGQPLYYVEDEEVDFEKLINAPLPKVPREISFTAHWLAVEGVQPSIPQNPTSAESRNQELVPKGPGQNANFAAMSGNDNVTIKPLVKHVLSKELQMYFEKVTSALLDEPNNDYRIAALASIRSDPGLHQLVPYFVQFIAEKVTHNLKNLFVLTQMIHLTTAMLENKSLYIDPYIASLIPPVLTCLVGRRLGNSPDPLVHYPLRRLAASVLSTITKIYSKSSHMLKPRLARTCLKNFLDPSKSVQAHYGAIIGLQAIGGPELVRALIVPNLKEYEAFLLEAIEDTEGSPNQKGGEMVVEALVEALMSLEADALGTVNGMANGHAGEIRKEVAEKIGDLLAGRVIELGRPRLVKAILEC
ncbi:histone H4-like TAF Taf6, SAGA complex subunit [Lecanora helva]